MKFNIKALFNFDILLITIYIVGAIVWLYFYQYQINPDGTAYLNIAQKYASGDLFNALNKFWPPLLSWSVAPLLIIGINPLLASKILYIIVGLVMLFSLKSLANKFAINKLIKNLLILICIPVIWQFVFSVVSPDLLLTTILLIYLNIIFSSNFKYKLTDCIYLGLLGGLAHFAKPFGLIYFLSSYLIFSIIYYISKTKKVIFRNFVLTILVTLGIVLFWIIILSIKYQNFTSYVSNYGKFTHSFVGPNSPNLFTFSENGFLPPQNNNLSIWEDPTNIPVVSWNPLGTVNEANYLIYKVKINSIYLFLSLFSFSYLSLIIILHACNKYFNNLKGGNYFDKSLLVLVILLLHLPLVFVWVDGRYLQLVYLILILYSGTMVTQLAKFKYLVLLLLIISFLKFPLSYLFENIFVGKNIYDITTNLKLDKNIPVGAKIASNQNFFDSVYIAYYLKGSYYGYTNKEDELAELHKYGIRYYILWNNKPILGGINLKCSGNFNYNNIHIFKICEL